MNDESTMDEDMILPDDYVEETTIDTTEESENATEEPEQEEETAEPDEEAEVDEVNEDDNEKPKEEPKKLKVKYLHEEKYLTEDEAIPLIQKGMNHDRLQEQLNALKSDPRLTLFDTLAKENGMTGDQYLQVLNDNIKNNKIQVLAEEKGIDFDIAKELYEAKEAAKPKPKTQLQIEEETRQEKINRENEEFLAHYPNIKAEEIEKEVWEMVKSGDSLLTAYIKNENNKLNERIKILEQNKTNKQKAPVKGVTAHGSQEIAAEDDFLQGFNSIE